MILRVTNNPVAMRNFTYQQELVIRTFNGFSRQVPIALITITLGASASLSGNGSALAVGATTEDSSAKGISGDQINDATTNSGAVYLY